MFAVKRWPAAWRPMFERGDHVALMLPITPATPPRRSSDCSAASPTSWRTSPRPTTKFARPFAPSAPTGASINRSRPTHRARLHPRQALIALGPTRRVRFVSVAHSTADIDRTVEAVDTAMHVVTVRRPELLI